MTRGREDGGQRFTSVAVAKDGPRIKLYMLYMAVP